ncbi:hypothetical protein AB0L34_34135, partial [Micromonospora sp. NPDC052213]
AVRLVLNNDSSPANRVNALIALIDSGGQHLYNGDKLFADALHEAAGHPDLTAQILVRQAFWANVNGDPDRACAQAARAASLARSAGDTATTAMAHTMQARIQRILGRPQAETTLGHALSLPRSTHIPVNARPEQLSARHAIFDDRLDEARSALLPLLVEAERTGDAEATVDVLRSLAEVEIRAGRCGLALDYAGRALSLTDRAALDPAPTCYTSALVEGTASCTDSALAHARRGADTSRREDNKVFLSRNLFVLGHLLLVTGRPKEALEALEEVRTLEKRQQVRDPSVLRWHADLAQALISLALACLRTKTVGSPVSCDITVAIGMPPISIPANTSHSGSRATIASATSRSSSGFPSNRYLSKYSSLTCPDRRWNRPVRWQVS